MAVDFAKIVDNGYLKITNKRLAENKIYIETGADSKIDSPDPGKIEYLAKGIIHDADDTGKKYIVEKNDGIMLQLYRVNTRVLIPAATGTTEETYGKVIITPTLSEEVAYYYDAVAELNKIYGDEYLTIQALDS